MGMFVHRTDDSGDNYWDTVDMVKRKEEELTDYPDNESWEQACNELGITAKDIINHEHKNIAT